LKRINAVVCVGVVLLLAGCSGSLFTRPTAAPKPTMIPEATVGVLETVNIEKFNVSLLAPTTWQPPALTDDSIVISPAGSTDTAPTAGVLMYIIPDAANTLGKRVTFTFKPEVSDPVQQLALLMEAINVDQYRFSTPEKYEGAKYPAAMVTGFALDNQVSILLMNAGNNRWLYVGLQAPEKYFKYYNSVVFQPVTNSIVVP
jgi:hypothetical protein